VTIGFKATPSPACGPKPKSVGAWGTPSAGGGPSRLDLMKTAVAGHPLPQGGEGTKFQLPRRSLSTRFQKFAHLFPATHAEMALRRRRSGSFRVRHPGRTSRRPWAPRLWFGDKPSSEHSDCFRVADNTPGTTGRHIRAWGVTQPRACGRGGLLYAGRQGRIYFLAGRLWTVRATCPILRLAGRCRPMVVDSTP
jgi:hypothetical protein